MRSTHDTARRPRAWLVAPLAAVVSLAASLVPAGPAAAATTFHITRLVPAHIYVIENGPRKTLKIEWTGPATFPVTAHYVPVKGCTSHGVVCAAGQRKFITRANTLVWKRAAWCTGNRAPWTRKWVVFLVDARHHSTPKVIWTLTCRV